MKAALQNPDSAHKCKRTFLSHPSNILCFANSSHTWFSKQHKNFQLSGSKMASSHPRKSLDEMFPELRITTSPKKGAASSRTTSPTKSPTKSSASQKKSLARSFREGIKQGFGWPSWTAQPKTSPFIIELSAYLKTEATKLAIPASPEDIIQAARESSVAHGLDGANELWEMVEESLIRLVYGSNRIENAGRFLAQHCS